ncbi:MAG: ABC transporter permease [Pseudomonadota bacterium]
MSAFSDVSNALRQPNIWFVLGVQDYRFQFGRTAAGLLWAFIQPALWITAIGFFFAPFMGNDSGAYIIHVAFGLAMFTFMSGAISEYGLCFMTHKTIIQNFSLPMFIHVLRDATRNTCRLATELTVAFAAVIFLRHSLEPVALLAVFGLAVNIIAAVAISLGVSMLTVRWRDIQFAIRAVMRLMFFMTPILWSVDQTSGARATVANINPLTHFIEIVRQPILGEVPTMLSYGVTSSVTLAAIIGSYVVFGLRKNNIALWAQT